MAAVRRCVIVLWAILALSVASCGGGGSDRASPRVLLVTAADVDYQADMVSKLQAFGVFQTVEGLDASTTGGTPTLSELLGYDAVMVVKDDSFLNRTDLGNVLADYVDQGRGVVLAHFVFEGSSHPAGRFETASYTAIDNGFAGSDDGPFGMSVVNSHPILQGVTSFDGGTASFRPEGASTVPGSTIVATWDDGASTPLIVTRTIGAARRCDLGFYPPTSDTGRTDFVQASSDSMLIVANALRWVAGDL